MLAPRTLRSLAATAVAVVSIAGCSQAEAPDSPTASGPTATAQPFTAPTGQWQNSTAWLLSSAGEQRDDLAGLTGVDGAAPVERDGIIYFIAADQSTVTATDTSGRATSPIAVKVVAVDPGDAATAAEVVAVSEPVRLLPRYVSPLDPSSPRWLSTRGFQAGGPTLTLTNPGTDAEQVVLVGYTGTAVDAADTLVFRPVTAGDAQLTLEAGTDITVDDTNNPVAWNLTGGDLVVSKTDRSDAVAPLVTSARPVPSGEELLVSAGGGEHTVTGPTFVEPRTRRMVESIAPTVQVDGRSVDLPAFSCGQTASRCPGLTVGVLAAGPSGFLAATSSEVGPEGHPAMQVTPMSWDGEPTAAPSTVALTSRSQAPQMASMQSTSGLWTARTNELVTVTANMTGGGKPLVSFEGEPLLVTDQELWIRASSQRITRLGLTDGAADGTEILPDSNVPLGVSSEGVGVFRIDGTSQGASVAPWDVALVMPAK